MANSYSVTAILSAKDNGFTSTLKNALSSVNSLSGKVGSGLKFGVLAGVGQQAFSMITSGVKSTISEMNSANASWKTFTGNMEMLGKSSGEIKGIKSELQAFAEQTVYSASDMATTFSQLEAVGTKNTTSLVKGFGGLAAAAENPQQAMKTLSQQATQMAAKPNVAWQDFKLMLEQTPAGIAAIAKEMGMTTAELVKGVQDGEIATQDFFNAISKVGTNDAFTKLATTYKTAGQAMDGLQETVANKLNPAFDVLSKVAIDGISGIIDKLGQLDPQAIANKVSQAVSFMKTAIGLFKSAFSGVRESFLDAFGAIAESLGLAKAQFNEHDALLTFKQVCDKVAEALKKVASFIEQHADTIAKVLPWVGRLAAAFVGLKVLNSVAPWLTGFAGGLAKLAGKGIAGLAGKLFGIGGGAQAAGNAGATAGKQMMQAAASFLMVGAAVALIAVSFAILVQSAIALSNAGGLAIGIFIGMAAAVVALGVGMAFLLKSLAPMGASLVPVATSMLALGAAVLLVAAGFGLMAMASIALANSGGAAIAVMAGMVVALAGLMALAAALAPAMAVGAAGFLAFGAAIALVGVGAVLAAASLAIIAAVLPSIVAHGAQGAVAIAALGSAMLTFAGGAATAGAASLLLGAGLLVAAAGMAAAGIAAIALGAGLIVVGAGAIVAGAGLMILGASLPMIAAMGTQSAAAILALSAALLALSAPLALVGATALVSAAGVLAFGAAMLTGAAGALAMAAALKSIQASMKSIASNAKSAEASLTSMQASISIVESGLNALGSMAQAAMSQLVSSFTSAAGQAQAAGTLVATGFTNGLRSGLMLAPIVARTAVTQVAVVLRSGYSFAYQAGAYVTQGFAEGMASCLGEVQAIAAKIVALVEKVISAKAEISSPSKLTAKLGAFVGEGFAVGISEMSGRVKDAAESLVSIPSVNTPNLALAYAGEMSDSYSYYRNAEYVIEVPLTVDGKEVARATATYTQDELNKRVTRDQRKHGKV